jgi:hypothetical protein
VARELPLPPGTPRLPHCRRAELAGALSLVAVSLHASIRPTVRPNLDRAFEALEPLLAGRSFVLGGDLNLSRNYDKVHGTTHHTEFLDGLATRGFFDWMRKFPPRGAANPVETHVVRPPGRPCLRERGPRRARRRLRSCRPSGP